jgi:hypothetical protein
MSGVSVAQIKETGCGGVNWIHLAQDKDQRWNPVDSVTNIGKGKVFSVLN